MEKNLNDKNKRKEQTNAKDAPIPQMFSREQVEGIVAQATSQLQQQIQEAGQLNQQLRNALTSNNTSEIYRRIGMLLDLTKSPELFGDILIDQWKTEILELVEDTKLIKVDTTQD